MHCHNHFFLVLKEDITLYLVSSTWGYTTTGAKDNSDTRSLTGKQETIETKDANYMEANYLDAYYNDSKSMDMDTAEKNFRDTETLSKSEGSVKASGGETSTLLSYINIDKDGWVLFVYQYAYNAELQKELFFFHMNHTV